MTKAQSKVVALKGATKQKQKGALINFDADQLKLIDAAAKAKGVTRTDFVKAACDDALTILDETKGIK